MALTALVWTTVGAASAIATVSTRLPSIGPDWTQFQASAAHTGAGGAGEPSPALKVAWRFDGSKGPVSGPVFHDRVVAAVGRTGVFGVDATTGVLAWQVSRSDGPLAMPAVGALGDGTTVLVFTEGDTTKTAAVVAIDFDTRKELWRQPLKTVSGSGATIAGDEAYLGDRSGNLYAFGLSDGTPASWSPLGLATGSVDAPPAASGSAVVVTERNHDTGEVKVEAVDPSTGKDLWVFDGTVSAGTATAPTLAGDHALFGVGGQQDLKAVALSSSGDAVTAWSARTRSTFSPLSAPAASGDDVFVVSTSSSDAALYAFDATDGSKRWDFQFQEPAIETSPIVIGSAVYVGSDDGFVAGIDTRSGLETTLVDTGPGAIGPLAVAGSDLIASKRGSRGGLVAFEHDPNGHVLAVESPTTLHTGTDLGRYALAFLAVFVVVFGGVSALRRFRPGPGPALPATNAPADGEAAAEPQEEA